MKDFEYNWATAEMIIMYLRNSRAQERRRVRNTVEVSVAAQDAPAANLEPVLASGSTGRNDSDSDDSSDDDL